jgi:class 3 adenylate cyclase
MTADVPAGVVTFLFTDIEGSTRLWEQDSAAMHVALARHDEILRGAIESRRGSVVKTTGDGVMAVFGDTVDGLNAALAAQSELQAQQWALSRPLMVRMGLHTGTAHRRDGDYFGSTLNRTARLMGVAHGGRWRHLRRPWRCWKMHCPTMSWRSISVNIGCAI